VFAEERKGLLFSAYLCENLCVFCVKIQLLQPRVLSFFTQPLTRTV
jgi:hypothetical protein